MKSLFIFSLLVFTGSFSQAQFFNIGKQNYILCSSTFSPLDYEARLENAAVGPVKSLTLSVYENNNWNLIADRPVTNINRIVTAAPQPPLLPEGNYTEIDTGTDFVAVRTADTIHPFMGMLTDKLVLKILIGKQTLEISFNCTTVE